ncbi:MAG TPA: acetyltransferase [Thermoanaerobaculia bacterium]|nr:acetyltransferase [Thermoanaerobaculia bacterium]
MKETLLIWGASGHARVVADIVRLEGAYEIAGFIDDAPERAGVLGGREVLADFRGAHLIVAFGDNEGRVAAARFAIESGLHLATAIHPSAVVAASARIGAGTVVAANAVVNPGADVGENSIINTGATVDHDCVLGEGVHVSPGAHLAGGVRVGDCAWIGIGAAVADGRTIGRGAWIGAGAAVVADIPDDVVAYGVPARVVRSRAASSSHT